MSTKRKRTNGLTRLQEKRFRKLTMKEALLVITYKELAELEKLDVKRR